jgi:hypothetical protein
MTILEYGGDAHKQCNIYLGATGHLARQATINSETPANLYSILFSSIMPH